MGNQELEHPDLTDTEEEVDHHYILLIRFNRGTPLVDSFMDITDCLDSGLEVAKIRARMIGEDFKDPRLEKGRNLHTLGWRARFNQLDIVKITTKGFTLSADDADAYIKGLHKQHKLEEFITAAKVSIL